MSNDAVVIREADRQLERALRWLGIDLAIVVVCLVLALVLWSCWSAFWSALVMAFVFGQRGPLHASDRCLDEVDRCIRYLEEHPP